MRLKLEPELMVQVKLELEPKVQLKLPPRHIVAVVIVFVFGSNFVSIDLDETDEEMNDEADAVQ